MSVDNLAGKKRRVRTLRLLHDAHVLLILVRHALHKVVHLEVVDQARLLLLASSRNHVPPIRIKQAGKAPYKRCANLVGPESGGANDTHGADASAVRIRAATWSLSDKNWIWRRRLTSATIEPFVRLFLAYGASCLVFVRIPLHAMALLPSDRLSVPHGLHGHAGHDGGCGQGRLRVDRWRICGGRAKLVAQGRG
jgi:hypothetical protein